MSAPDENGWMPIATAPRDGTEILVFVEDHRNPELRICVAWFVAKPDGSAKWMVFSTPDAIFSLAQPVTHWQPLPKPPTNTEPHSSQIAVSSADHAQTEPTARSGEKSAATNPKGDA